MSKIFLNILTCMIIHDFFLRILLLSLVGGIALSFLLRLMGYKKFICHFWIGFLILPALIFTVILYDWFFGETTRRIYYIQAYKKDEIRVVEDSDFLFNKEKFSVSYQLNSNYFTAHRILLIPESKSVPIDYEFDGELLVEIYDTDDGILKSFLVEHPHNILRRWDDDNFKDYIPYLGSQPWQSISVFAFELGKIPFSIIRPRRGKLENLEIKITVLKPDEKLKEYCDKATLVIIPDLRL